jgi:hypothetical protein
MKHQNGNPINSALTCFSDESFLFLICRKKSSEIRVLAALGFDFYVNKIYYHNKTK